MDEAMVFTLEEFEEFIYEVTYDTIGVCYDVFDGFSFVEVNMTDEQWDDWLKWYGVDVEKEINSFEDDYEFVYTMLGKRFNAVVKNIVCDIQGNAVALIFE